MPPYQLLSRKTVNPSYAIGLPPGSITFEAEPDWMKSDAFNFWIKHRFMKSLPSTHPIISLLDGHSSHTDFATGKLCKESKTDLMYLPLNPSRITQPLDKVVFSPFKNEYCKQYVEFTRSNTRSSVDIVTFRRVFANLV